MTRTLYTEVKSGERLVATDITDLTFFPKGTILIFSSAAYNAASTGFKNIWKICDGQNGTPNLVNTFLRGGVSSGSTGGTDSITLKKENLPAHNHNHTLSVEDSTHGHSLRGGSWGGTNCDGLTSSYQIAGRNQVWGADGYYERARDGTSYISANTHKHTLLGSISSSTGGDQAFSIIPKYYTVIYIMKVA
ncbi:MAG: hypothetical protein LBL50_01915 [Candidatus Margulisbacteria bacterium]|nr:hypothetical protein [Candidatus Margulisiibacteriota bacterium]